MPLKALIMASPNARRHLRASPSPHGSASKARGLKQGTKLSIKGVVKGARRQSLRNRSDAASLDKFASGCRQVVSRWVSGSSSRLSAAEYAPLETKCPEDDDRELLSQLVKPQKLSPRRLSNEINN